MRPPLNLREALMIFPDSDTAVQTRGGYDMETLALAGQILADTHRARGGDMKAMLGAVKQLAANAVINQNYAMVRVEDLRDLLLTPRRLWGS